MRERVAALIGPVGERMWVSTFHSACVRILRREHEAAGLRSTFSIYDAADSTRLVTLVVRILPAPTAFVSDRRSRVSYGSVLFSSFQVRSQKFTAILPSSSSISGKFVRAAGRMEIDCRSTA